MKTETAAGMLVCRWGLLVEVASPPMRRSSLMSDSSPRSGDSYDRQVAALYTPKLRTSNEPRWERLRTRLAEVGVAPTDAAVGSLFPDDVNLEFGILATRDGRAFSFEFDFLRDESGNAIPSPAEARVEPLVQLNERQMTFTYARGVWAAHEYLSEEAS